MNTYTVRHKLFELLQSLELQNRKKYNWAEIGRKIGTSRQSTQHLFTSDQTVDSSIRNGTLAGILAFFESEGMPISIGDVYDVTTVDSE